MQNVQPVEIGNPVSLTNAAKQTNDTEIELLQRVFEIYDHKLITEALQLASSKEWARPALLRKLKGNALAPTFSPEEMQA
ncbi:hypothetical protein BZY71_23930, partial [Leclercia adecarboxylata]